MVKTVTVANYNGCTQDGPYLYQDANGATHDLNLAYVNQDDAGLDESPQCSQYLSALTGQTIDGSALSATLNSGNDASVIEPDGTTVSLDGILEDSNGNKSGTGEEDAEGRQLLTMTSGKCRFAGAPVGTPSTCDYTTAASDGTALPYSITTEGFELGFFEMPHPVSAEMQTNAYMAPVSSYWAGFTVNQAVNGTSISGVTNVSYPDGTSYSFTYDPVYATIDTIIFPTGGSVQFKWGIRAIGTQAAGFVQQSTLVVTDVYLSSGSGATSHWSYSYPDSTSGGSTETDPDGTVIVHSSNQAFLYSTVFKTGIPTSQETLTDTTSASGVHMRSVATFYGGGPAGGEPTYIQTTYYDANPVVQQCNAYSYDQWDNVTEKDESDIYPYSSSMCNVPSGKWLRETFTTYPQSQPYCPQSGTCPAGTATIFGEAHIVNKPSQIEVTDGR